MRGIFNSVYISDLSTNISTNRPQAVNLLVQLPLLLPGFTTYDAVSPWPVLSC